MQFAHCKQFQPKREEEEAKKFDSNHSACRIRRRQWSGIDNKEGVWHGIVRRSTYFRHWWLQGDSLAGAANFNTSSNFKLNANECKIFIFHTRCRYTGCFTTSGHNCRRWFRLGGHQSWSWRCGKRKILALLEIELGRRYTDWVIPTPNI
jgi:hypothetical protein